MKKVAVGIFLVSLVLTGRARASSTAQIDLWRGEARDNRSRPLEGRHSMRLRFLARGGDQPLYEETHSRVEMSRGAFTVQLGSGRPSNDHSSSSNPSLQDVYCAFPDLELEVEIDGRIYGPRLRVVPAGHSQASRTALSGPTGAGDPSGRHWEGWNAETNATAIQAAALSPSNSPAIENGGNGQSWRNPMLLEVNGPVSSIAVRDLPDAPLLSGADSGSGFTETEVNVPRHETLYDSKGNLFGTTVPLVEDELAKKSQSFVSAVSTPSLGTNFDGINNIDGYYPPDIEGSVGPNHYIQTVNVRFSIWNKSGTVLKASTLTNSLWTGFGGLCQTDNSGDAIVVYDRQADRWVITQFTSGNLVCFAVSKTPDPLGQFWLYSVPTLRFPDYYKLGIWPDAAHNAYFMGTNSGSQTQYDVYAIDRQNMLTGAVARPAQAFQNFANLLLPADSDGPTLPPAGSPGYFYTLKDGGEPYFGSPATDRLEIYEFNVNWTTPASTTFALKQAITPAEGLANFNWTVCGFFVNNCLPQPGTTVKIDSGSWWPLQRFQYRNFGTREAMVGNWTVKVGTSQAAPRWFEFRKTNQAPGGTWTLYQQGTHAPDSFNRWEGSISMDGDGDIALGYSVVDAGTNLYPTIRYATRLVSDPLGTLQTEATLQAGSGAQTGAAGRWGDYSSMDVDPVDDCTFWFTSEYLSTTGGAPWRTRIASFKLPECGGFSTTPASQQFCPPGSSLGYTIVLNSSTFSATTNMSITSCPPGATCSFSPNPVTLAGGNTTTLTISGLAGVATGTYNPSVTATDSVDGTKSKTKTVSVQKLAVPIAPSLSSPADGAAGASTSPTLSWAAVPDAVSYLVELSTSVTFSPMTFTTTTPATSVLVAPALLADTLYFWRVTATNSCGSAMAVYNRFRTAASGVPVSICSSAALGLAIPDNTPAGASTTLAVGAIGPVTDLNVSLNVTHTWVGDLRFDVKGPGGIPTVRVFDRPTSGTGGCSNDNISTVLDDAAAASVQLQCAVTAPSISGTFAPANPLSAFNAINPSGTWTLTAIDSAAVDIGTVNQWCLIITPAASSAAAATEVSSNPSAKPLLVRKNGSNVDLEFQDINALNYNVYVSNKPRNTGTNQFEVNTTNGKRICNVNPKDPGAPAGKLRKAGFDLTLGTQNGVWYILVSGDNGVALSEGPLGQDSVPANIIASQYCNN